jgi:hypothetical protein
LHGGLGLHQKNGTGSIGGPMSASVVETAFVLGDELPPPEPELPLITDLDTRLGIQDRIHAAWTDFDAREWMGATVFAGNIFLIRNCVQSQRRRKLSAMLPSGKAFG